MEMKYGDEDAQPQEEQQPRQRFHVLAVDDSLVDRKVLERLLRVSSYQVTCVDSGNKALEYLGLLDDLDNASSLMPPPSSSSPPSSQSLQQQEAKVDLIMTDYCMPGMSGYDLLKRLKGSSWKDVPVVVMSSENIPSRITKCLEGGAEEFLLKPLQISDVEKLQPHLLKSLGGQPCTCKTLASKEDGNNKNNNNVNSNNASKRKAMSPEPSERISKMKQLAVA